MLPRFVADESLLGEPLAVDDETGSFHLEFEIVPDSSKRGKNKLTYNRGYTYNVKRRRGGTLTGNARCVQR